LTFQERDIQNNLIVLRRSVLEIKKNSFFNWTLSHQKRSVLGR